MNNLRISLMHNNIDLGIIAAIDDLIIKHLVFSDGKRRSILSPMDTWWNQSAPHLMNPMIFHV